MAPCEGISYIPIIVTVVLFICLLYALVRVISKTSGLEWAHLVSSRSNNDKQWADWGPIGKGGAVIVCVTMPFIYVYSPGMDGLGLAGIMAASLGYLGGVSAYSATLRSKQNSKETTLVTEDTPLSRKTETILERGEGPK